ncbi:HEAT repeat-containing protein 5 [Marchantia polymorpha subsp. ruderalis]|uniref:LAA1-like C-terminal TPR repeats domain-containing protein n=2 Tax=Marchantia polymorpha TaxID=3197 RepID=A0AAF6BC49_MARPO|nr:hypothetical protein MARPO_0101s0033 [Marchantia polymorpha]BBN09583.1 hypothetical protein Mp_4g20870 [Marchantia polymorpha subsp. ruderalis]|eukprot:PTQ32240.1 hypothetical protein MARPO_0101s0033 [Marchantia polymorpha]
MAEASKLSKLNIIVAQLESIVAAAAHKLPEPLICFDLLVDLLSTIDQEPKDSILRCQRKCEDALQALLVLGVRPPVRRLASTAMVSLIEKGDNISIYSRAGSLQGWLSDKMDKKSEPASCIGVAQCLGALLRAFGQRISSGLVETSSIVAKLMRYSEVGVRQAALELLQDALEGSGGGGAVTAYTEALRIIMKLGATDKSAVVRAAAAGCLRAFAVAGGQGLGVGGLENCATVCLKALEDSAQPVRDGFAAALGALLALGLNPQSQAQPKGRGPSPPLKTIDGGVQKHLVTPFVKASGQNYKEIRVGLTMAWVAFLQGMRLNYMHNDVELQEFAMEAIKMLTLSSDTHAQACVLFCLRVGIIEQMGEPAQKGLTDHLIKQLSTPEINSGMLVVILRSLAHLLSTLGEVSVASRETLDNSLVGMLSNSSMAVRVEAALALRALAEVDASSANNLLSCGLTTLRALRETVSVEKGDRLKLELDSLHGQAAMLAALITAVPKLVLGVPSRLPQSVWDVAKLMVSQDNGNPSSMGAEKEAGWMLIASILSSMPKEELEERKLEILVLWSNEFGGNVEDHLKKAESMLGVHLSGWSAAVEALAAFVKSFVFPNMSVTEEGILLQPIIGYLSGALAYLTSSALQQAPAALKPAVNLFTIRTLRAFQALPDPFSYKDDHPALMGICTAPFRDAASCGASSCLRQLLDSRDASLGPWIPGRDSFEDELRAFEGGAQGLLPCVWAYEVPAFPQPLPVATVLVDEMLLCFGTVFAAQTEKGKLQLLEIILESARAGKKQSWHSANITNICVALLGGLKASIGMRSQGSEVDAMRQVQEIFQSILSEDGISPAGRRAAAEGLGFLARLGSDVFAARLTRSLVSDTISSPISTLKGSTALALGCVHRSVGGMALSALVPATVQALCALAKDPNDYLHGWALHALWLTADAAGLSYVPHVQATLSLAMEILLSEDHAAPELGQRIGRLVNAVVAVLGPELSPGSSLFSRCKALVAEISTENEPAAQLECVLFTQQLALFAPRALPVHAHVQTLRPTLTSRQPSLRQAAASTLRHLSERDPVAMVEEHIEEDLFAMLDNETDESIIKIVRSTLQRLLEAACPSFPSRWLNLCRNVVLAASTTKSAGAGLQESERFHNDIVHEDMGEDNEGMIADRPSAGLSGPVKIDTKAKDSDQLPRYKTRVFAAECLCRLPVIVGVEPAHFDLVMVKELQKSGQSPGGDWLVLHLGELVAVAYQVATGTMESVRPIGVELLDIVLDKFGETVDPEFEGHLLLEQYQAQLVSAVRTALDPAASPLLMAAGSRLAARIITSGGACGDRALLQRMMNLLNQPLLKWEDIVNPNFAEWVGCKVQVSLLGAHAAVKTYAYACSQGNTKSSSDSVIILPLLAKHADILGRYWIGILRDYTALRLHATTKLQPGYKPFMEGIQLVSIASMVLHFLSEVWPVVLEAVTVDAYPAGPSGQPSEGKAASGIELSVEDFRQIWALAILVLSEEDDLAGERRRSSVTSFPSVDARFRVDKYEFTPQLAALHSLRSLCSEGFYDPQMLSVELCKELVQILSKPFVNVKSNASHAVLSVLDQVAKSCPQGYIECKDIALNIVELCLGNIFQLLNRSERTIHAKADEVERVMSNALETLGNLVGHLNAEVQEVLLPQLLSAGIKILNLVPVDGIVVTSALGFITNVTAATAKPVQGVNSSEEFDLTQRASILAAAVESLAKDCVNHAEQVIKGADGTENKAEQVLSKRLELLLGVMVSIVPSVPEIISVEESGPLFKKAAQGRCINCLRWFLTNSNIQVQLAALQNLRTVSQTGSSEPKGGDSHTWALILLRELGADVTQVVYEATQKPLTSASAAAVGECLKLLILLYSLVEGDEAQQNVLHLLLPAIIAAASFQKQGSSQATNVLTAAAVKLVTHLASVPSSAAQFRTVLLQLPPESRQQLQAIIKASMSQQPSSSYVAAPAPVPLPPPKLFTPAITTSGLAAIPPPSSSSLPRAIPAAPQPAQVDDFEDDDDDWDDFQDGSQDVTSSTPTPDVNMDSDFQPFSPGPSNGTSTLEPKQDGSPEEDVDDFERRSLNSL